jgi:hypothetical protein
MYVISVDMLRGSYVSNLKKMTYKAKKFSRL